MACSAPGSSTPTGTCWPASSSWLSPCGPYWAVPGRRRRATRRPTSPGGRPISFSSISAALLISTVGRLLVDFIPAIDQPMEAVARIKLIALLMLFGGVLSVNRGVGFLLGAVMVELVIGFSGLLGDFRSVFIILFISALAVRIRWTAITSIVVGAAAILLVFLALFWTSVKAEYREVATGSDDSQNVKMSLDTRFGYLGGRVASVGDIDWSRASYALLNRLAYIDIFGSVIGVKLVSPEQGSFRQWSDALGHVFQPRFLFPNKQALSDTEVFVRLARGDASEQMRSATVDQRRLHVRELRRSWFSRHAGGRVHDRPGRGGGMSLLHGRAAALDRPRGHRPGVHICHRQQRRGNVAAQAPGRRGHDVRRLCRADQVRLSHCLALARRQGSRCAAAGTAPPAGAGGHAQSAC